MKKRYTEEIVFCAAASRTRYGRVADHSKKLGVSEATFYRRRKKYVGLVRHLKQPDLAILVVELERRRRRHNVK